MLPLSKDADQFAQLVLKPAALAKLGLPGFTYPIRKTTLEAMIVGGGNIDVREIVLGLMDWLDHTDEPEPALDMLEQILEQHCPPDGRATAHCQFQTEHGHIHSFYLGHIDWSAPLAAWQRRDWLIAAATAAPADPLRMLVFAPRPVSLDVARSIHAHSVPVDMGEPSNSMATLKRSASSIGSFYDRDAGAATVTDWGHGLGWTKTFAGKLVHNTTPAIPNQALAPNQLVWLIALANDYA